MNRWQMTPRAKWGLIGIGAFFGLLILGGIISAIAGGGKAPPDVASAAASVAHGDQWSDGEAQQVDRKALIDKMVEAGAFRKVDIRAQGATAWVTPLFYAADFDTKEALTGTVLEYVMVQARSKNVVVILRDVNSGKQAGARSRFGLTMK